MFEVLSRGVVDKSSAGRLRVGQRAEREARVKFRESHCGMERGGGALVGTA
jgi:hypothetical protein